MYCFPSLAERSLSLAFAQVLGAWEQVKPVNRKAQLNVNFVMRKLCEMLGYGEYTDRIPQIKTHKTLKQLELYWNQVLARLEWPLSSPQAST